MIAAPDGLSLRQIKLRAWAEPVPFLSPSRMPLGPFTGVASTAGEDVVAIIEATPTNHLTFLTTAYGRAFTPSGFGNKFREWCNEAELPHCSAHSLRKAAAARLAERGATAHEIMAITGHRSLEEVERYTRAARQGKLADAAIAKLKPRTDLVPPE